jgi:hypothetical protein
VREVPSCAETGKMRWVLGRILAVFLVLLFLGTAARAGGSAINEDQISWSQLGDDAVIAIAPDPPAPLATPTFRLEGRPRYVEVFAVAPQRDRIDRPPRYHPPR